MLHKDLKINGKPVFGEKELEPFFTMEHFSCDIGDLVLDVEFSPKRAAFIGWLDTFNDDVFYFDNGSGNQEMVPLCINACPEERMMCYDSEILRDIVRYFCETGERNPKYNWIEDLR